MGGPSCSTPDGFAERLADLGFTLENWYETLGLLADDLEIDMASAEESPDQHDALSRRLTLGDIRDAVLDAHHRLHGGLVAVVRARPMAGRHA